MSVEDGTDFKLYTCIPEGSFGLIMFYVSSIDSKNKLTVTLKAAGGKLTKYNDTTQITSLEDGMVVINVPSSVTSITLSCKNKGTITFSNLDIIPSNDKFNHKLGLSAISEEQVESNILEKLKKYENFYYNCIIDNGNSIRFNANDDDDTLADVDAWYDYNNIANKFFIAELDADYFDTGIIIDKASKLK